MLGNRGGLTPYKENNMTEENYKILNSEIKSHIEKELDKFLESTMELAYIQATETMSPNDMEFTAHFDDILESAQEYIYKTMEGETT
jgi:hypothetical protein